MKKEDGLSSTRKFVLSLILMAILVLLGTLGFALLENMGILEAIYMTIITLSTVGFGEIRPLHPAGRVFVIILIVFGVVLATFLASTIGQLVLEGQLRKILGRRKMHSKISKLNNHNIIAGFGRVGRQVAEEFVRRKVPFVVLEKDQTALDQLETSGYYYIQGEATEDDILLAARIDHARVLVTTLPNEADNVFMSLTARYMNPGLFIIARADNPEGEKKLKRAGANIVVSPHVLGGVRMAMSSLRPNVVDFMQMTSLGEAGLGIEEVSIPIGCRFGGKSLVDSGIKAEYGVTVVGIKKPNQEWQINPPPSARIEEDDVLILVGTKEELERLTVEMS